MQKLLFIIIFFSVALKSSGQVLEIKKAIEEKTIDYDIMGSWDRYDKQEFLDASGQYFGKCMTLKLYNRIDSIINIFIENGILLMCDDTLTQDMIVTEPIYVKLYPKQNKTIQLYAMCTEIHDGIPNRLTAYKFGKMADSNLISITKSIEELFMNNIVGQGAVWAYTDNAIEDDLRKYGATDASISKTIEILNKSNVVTALNAIQPIDTSLIDNNTNQLSNSNDKGIISIKIYIVYCAGVVFLILIGILIFILLRQRNSV